MKKFFGKTISVFCVFVMGLAMLAGCGSGAAGTAPAAGTAGGGAE